MKKTSSRMRWSQTFVLDDLVLSIREMDQDIGKEKFNYEESFRVLLNSTMKIQQFAHFVIFRVCSNYESAKKAILDCQKKKGKNTFQAA